MVDHGIKWHQKLSYGIITNTELFFYKLGYNIAKHPYRTIFYCWTIVLISCTGLFQLYQEKDPFVIWIPTNSQFKKDGEWLMKTVEAGFRSETTIIEAEDVLTPEVIKYVYNLDKQVREAVSSHGYTYEDVCFRLPDMGSSIMMLFSDSMNPSKDEILKDEKEYDPSLYFSPETYCNFLETIDSLCYVKSILDLWQYSERRISILTKEDIVNKINLIKEDPILRKLKSYQNLLGGIERNETGHIIKAKAIRIDWITKVNMTAVNMKDVGNIAGTTEWANFDALDWTNEFIKIMLNNSKSIKQYNSAMSLNFSSSRSYGDIAGATMFDGLEYCVVAGVIMLVYIQIVISKLNWVEFRGILGAVGILTVGMALITGCGVCSYIGIPTGPIHASLPFLLMGLGVDDIFVIIASWEHLKPEETKKSLPERVGLMLKHAGVSITVTTATDVLAFFVGSTTVIPSLRSYCLYTAIGILIMFMLVVTFFIACFTLDQRRLENNYNGVFIWIKYDDFIPNKFSQANTSQKVFEYIYSKVIFTLPGKLGVLFMSLVFFGFSIFGILNLQQFFDFRCLIAEDTYLGKFYVAKDIYFPSYGYEGGIVVGAINYTHEFMNLRDMSFQLENSTDIIIPSEMWVQHFRDYVLKLYKKDLYNETLSDNEFNNYLSKFLFSPRGARFQANFKFSPPLECGKPATKIKMSGFDFVLRQLDNPKDNVLTMQRLMKISKNKNLTTGDKQTAAWSIMFAPWTADEIIEEEFLRNMILVLIAVMIATSLLIANVQICFWVLVSIVISIINVCGFMQFFGVAIDIVSVVALQLGIGLCVDYATHIGHKFLTITEGNRHDRILKTVTCIGNAVLNGGISTLICVLSLGLSGSYHFRTFFKILVLVVLFGLYNGLLLLPVILSWIGPKPYKKEKQQISHISQAEYDPIQMTVIQNK